MSILIIKKNSLFETGLLTMWQDNQISDMSRLFSFNAIYLSSLRSR